MTLDDLENSLPNGLHDAKAQRVSLDYKERKVTMDLSVWVGDINGPPEKREA